MIAQLENEIKEIYPNGLTWQKGIPTFHPESGEEAADIFRLAGKYGQRIYISGYNNNINPVGEPFADILVVKSDRLNSVVAVAPQDFYVTVGAGYPLMELNRSLRGHNLFFPFGDTEYPGSCGGALASGLAGSDGNHTVPLSRYLLSVTAVLPDGTIVKPGAVTFKSVSGYDISRIFYTSWGTLGIVIEMSFRVLPQSKRDEMPRLTLFRPDREAFVQEMRGESALARICRTIKAEYDPHDLLPIL
jgi:FAD/FMN-containing dehydrogenase